MPFTWTLALLLLAALVILTVIANVSKAAARRNRLALAASIARHPAGKGRVLESRHLDTPGYDWVNGDL